MKEITRFVELPTQSFFLFGARGTGKSTLLKQRFPDALYIDLLLNSEYMNYLNDPDRLINLIKANPENRVVIIDEIQRVSTLLPVVHYLMEQDKKRIFILTGSSARKLKKEGTNLLGGRARLKRMHPFTAFELGKMFNLNEALSHGLIPVILSSDDPAEQMNAYLNLYLKEEIQMEGLTRNIGNFSRFLEAISFSHGSLLNISNISRECSVERKVVESYIAILEDLLLSVRLPVFSKRAKRVLALHPKFYFFDTGIYKNLRPKGPLDVPEEVDGAGLEGLVYQNLIAYLDSRLPNHQLFFWRTKSGLEIDFILYGEQKFMAIEVKNSKKIRTSDLTAFTSFKEDYPEAECICLYRGQERIYQQDVLLVPVEDFLVHIDKYL